MRCEGAFRGARGWLSSSSKLGRDCSVMITIEVVYKCLRAGCLVETNRGLQFNPLFLVCVFLHAC